MGAVCIIVGGLVAAVTAPSPTEHASWAAAYLVLVAGVAQVGFGIGQAALMKEAPSSRLLLAEFIGWNLGNAGVIAGTVIENDVLLWLGSLVLIVTLGVLVWAVRGTKVTPGFHTRVLWTYRLLVLIILVSMPVGLIISAAKGN